jgi:hypothetical protein
VKVASNCYMKGSSYVRMGDSVEHIETSVMLRVSRAMAQAVSHLLLTAEARVPTQGSPCGIYGGQSGTGTGSPSPSVLACQHHFTAAPYSLMFIWGLDNGPVSGRSSRDTVSPHRNDNKVAF